MTGFMRLKDSEVEVDIKAVPGSSKTCFAGIKDERLRVKIAAAPEDGKANAELIAFTAAALGCAKRDVRMLRGEKSRLKTLAFPLAYREIFDKIQKGIDPERKK
jgi:uncharacterized protein (TIGR00251 family)